MVFLIIFSCAGVCKGWHLYAGLWRIPVCCEKMPRIEISCKYDCSHCLFMINCLSLCLQNTVLRYLTYAVINCCWFKWINGGPMPKIFSIWLYNLSSLTVFLTLFEMSQKDSQIQQLFMKIDYTGVGRIEWVWIIHCFPFKSQTCAH